jgi:DNA-binding NarL/FixJ family response regulator
MEKTRVTVTALDPITVAGLANCLSTRSGVSVVSQPRPDEVDVVVAAFDRLTQAAVARLRALAAELAKPIVLVVNEIKEVELLTAVECRVVALVPRSAATDDRLVKAIEEATTCGDEVRQNLLGRLIEHAELLHRDVLAPNGLGASSLSAREIDVLRLMADGLDTNEIARNLRYSERTVKNIIYAITNRLSLRNRSHAVAYAMRAGII